MTDHIFVHSDEIDRIDPNVYGHFAEHLGRCIYGGIWVGEDDPLETTDGMRTDTLELLSALDMPVLRWPGGCFADDYHWRDGVGPREERPRRRNLHWTQGRENVPEESNEFGTDEFARLCELLDTEPYLAANVGSGTPQEALDWLEYCNYDGDTALANMRRENGSEESHDVTYWGVGNENWGCGGNYTPEVYAQDYRRFATYLRTYGALMGERPELIACGHITGDWNRRFLEELGEDANMVDHLSVHRYYNAGDSTEFDDDEYYRLFAQSMLVVDDVDDLTKVLARTGANIGIIVDEWGVWHEEAKNNNGLEQSQTVRDALSAAGVFDEFNARADVLTMANVAQTVNVLQCLVQTDEETAWATPNYHVFDLYEPHMGATALRTTVATGQYDPDGDVRSVPYLSASASETDDGRFLTLSNRDLDARDVVVETGLEDPVVREATVLFDGLEPNEETTSDNAEEFEPADFTGDVDVEGGELAFEAPASSVVGVELAFE